MPTSVAGRLHAVRARIDSAARAAGRPPDSVQLIAVSKTVPLQVIHDAFRAGQRDFGENRVQEGLQKITESAELSIRWHLLGHLQRNKATKAAATFHTIQSVDSVDLLRRLDNAADEAGRKLELLIQVDLAGEAAKFGAPPDEARRMLDAAASCRAARVIGLMMLPPLPETPEDARPWFRRLRDIREAWLDEGVPPSMLHELSMGMSADFEVAIAEGATIVRIGTAIFGSRDAKH